jgi:hypothetical protein
VHTLWQIAQATSNQMSRHDSLRPCMDVIDEIMTQMVKEDPAFKPSGGRMGESDMDYDTDEKSMAALKRRLLKAQSSYYRYKSDYSGYVWEALELEETVKNLERGQISSDWCFISSIRPMRTGSFATILQKAGKPCNTHLGLVQMFFFLKFEVGWLVIIHKMT